MLFEVVSGGDFTKLGPAAVLATIRLREDILGVGVVIVSKRMIRVPRYEGG